jgi:hypothetical protein
MYSVFQDDEKCFCIQNPRCLRCDKILYKHDFDLQKECPNCKCKEKSWYDAFYFNTVYFMVIRC